MIKSPIDWNDLFIDIAIAVSQKSKDPNTKVGACVVSPGHRNIHIGYNGFPAGFPETQKRWERPNKYSYVLHAECNCILNAKCNLDKWTLYCTMHPCEKCSLLIVQSGISKVIYLNDATPSSDFNLAQSILSDGNVELIKYRRGNGKQKN